MDAEDFIVAGYKVSCFGASKIAEAMGGYAMTKQTEGVWLKDEVRSK